MFTDTDFKVRLNNPEEVKNFIKRHGEFASVCYDTPREYGEKVGLHCLESGHMSGSRHLYFDFSIDNVPRSLVDQLVRHEVGVVKNVESLRYCTAYKNVDIYASKEIMDSPVLRREIELIEANVQYELETLEQFLKDTNLEKTRINEIIRTIMPIGIITRCSFAVNVDGIMHLANVRLCNRAEQPIRHLVDLMCKEVIAVEPRYKKFLVPNCIKYGHCIEGKSSCGKFNEIKKLYE